MSSTASLSDIEKRGSSAIEAQELPSDAHGHARARKVNLSDVDVAAAVTAGKDLDAIDEKEAKRVLRQIDRHILPLMCGMCDHLFGLFEITDILWRYSDLCFAVRRQECFGPERSSGSTVRPTKHITHSILLIAANSEDAYLTQDQYNQLGTVFYVFYLAAEFPQNYLLQRFPVAKVLAINIFLWAVLLLCHAAAKSFAALATVRTFLALTESAIMPGFMVVTGMFYTREEAVTRVGSWCTCPFLQSI